MSRQNISKTSIVDYDPWLEPFADCIEARKKYYFDSLSPHLEKSPFPCAATELHKWLGVHRQPDGKIIFREWAPHAMAVFLVGEFNRWNRSSHPMQKISSGCWEIVIDNPEELERLNHQSLWKLHIIDCNNQGHDRISPFTTSLIQDENSYDFCSRIWTPENKVVQKAFIPNFETPFIYEAHVGMATEDERVGSYLEFIENVLPRIKNIGYNTIQFMAIMEHPFYGSYGYHVSSFFAPSSRFGTPDELKILIEACHDSGIAVIIDLVHSHAVKNFNEGFNLFDGSEDMYFHSGDRGYHTLWDSMLFNYKKPEVIQFLLSNVRFWLEEFNLDGFRFDGITSMLYNHHGLNFDFDSYGKYFDEVDGEAYLYLQLANKLIHEIRPKALSIAEDMSGMPGLGQSQALGGLGFDFRLGMGIPDYWVRILKEKKDEKWDLYQIWSELSSRRYDEKTIAYCESHDQALVGDKTLAFRMMDKEMYWHMDKDDKHPIISRGIALLKMIRLLTHMSGGEAWLNFIGNEFGHPEWIDFPREGNDWSHKYARRQWSLVDNPNLKYQTLNNFEKAMIQVSKEYNILSASKPKLINIDNDNMVLAFERAGLVFVFNFNVSQSFTGYALGVTTSKNYKIILSSDQQCFGGENLQDIEMTYPSKNIENHGFPQSLELYLISRSVIVLKPII